MMLSQSNAADVIPEPQNGISAPTPLAGGVARHGGRRPVTDMDSGLMVGGIILAGAAYPPIFALVTLVVFAPEMLSGFFDAADSWADALAAVLMFFAGMLLVSPVAMFLTGLTCMFVFPIAYLVAISMTLRPHPVWFGAFIGGLVGGLCVAPVFISALFELDVGPKSLIHFVRMLLVGPGLATMVGQIGGALSGKAQLQAWNERPMRIKPTLPPDETSTAWPSLRFGIRHLLWLCFWCSLFLAAIRVLNFPYDWTLGSLALWAAFQSLTMLVGWQIATRIWPRYRARRQVNRALRNVAS